jgi:hypothetical protein
MMSRNRAPAGYDRTHNLQVAWAYDLPSDWAKGKGGFGLLLRDWQVNGIMSAFTGTPFTVTAAAASLNAPIRKRLTSENRGYEVRGIGIGTLTTTQPPLHPSWCALNLRRNILRGPGVLNQRRAFPKDSHFERYGLDVRGGL